MFICAAVFGFYFVFQEIEELVEVGLMVYVTSFSNVVDISSLALLFVTVLLHLDIMIHSPSSFDLVTIMEAGDYQYELFQGKFTIGCLFCTSMLTALLTALLTAWLVSRTPRILRRPKRQNTYEYVRSLDSFPRPTIKHRMGPDAITLRAATKSGVYFHPHALVQAVQVLRCESHLEFHELMTRTVVQLQPYAFKRIMLECALVG